MTFKDHNICIVTLISLPDDERSNRELTVLNVVSEVTSLLEEIQERIHYTKISLEILLYDTTNRTL